MASAPARLEHSAESRGGAAVAFLGAGPLRPGARPISSIGDMSMRYALALPLLVAAGAASAEGPAVCAVEQAILCPRFEACERSLPAGINLPTLLRLDPDAGMMEARLDDGTLRRSAVATVVEAGGSTLMQGADDDLPWSLTVDMTSGAFSLVVADEDAGYVAFGVCSRALAR